MHSALNQRRLEFSVLLSKILTKDCNQRAFTRHLSYLASEILHATEDLKFTPGTELVWTSACNPVSGRVN